MYTRDEVDVDRICRFSALIRLIQVFPSHLLSVMYQAWLMFDDAFTPGCPLKGHFKWILLHFELGTNLEHSKCQEIQT